MTNKINNTGTTAFCGRETLTVAALACALLATQASATPFAFSTGEPDGKVATLSRPQSVGKMQTETADDLIVTQAIVINEAT
ncbi:MAG TPA: hypothetical protein VLT36_19465, partial [Candidatus Dormibacteraeota bacterium]|nr:hypothetical protein [Candidatus Dormibacteraeota bacterium]